MKSLELEKGVYTVVTNKGKTLVEGSKKIFYDATVADQGRADLNYLFQFCLCVTDKTLQSLHNGDQGVLASICKKMF